MHEQIGNFIRDGNYKKDGMKMRNMIAEMNKNVMSILLIGFFQQAYHNKGCSRGNN